MSTSFGKQTVVVTLSLWLASLFLFIPATVFAETDVIDLKALAKKARPAVMLVVVKNAKGEEIGTGTGFLVSSDGKLFTNFHVIKNAASAVAKAEGGGTFPVEGVLAMDPKNDLVLLQIKGKDLPFLTLAAGDKIEAGTRVAVIGSPLGLEGTISEGIVSAVRELMGERRMLQITAAISPGSSGSPVLNANGEVLGVATLIMRGGQGLNFAVPCEVARLLQASVKESSTPQPLSAVIVREEDKIFNDPDYRAAWAADAAEDYVEMLKRSQSLVRHYPDSPVAHICMGAAYADLKFDDDAIAAFRQAIKLKPDDAWAWSNFGCFYARARRWSDAIAAFQQATKLKPDDADAWYKLGVVYVGAKQADDAIAAYQQAIKLNPNNWKARLNLSLFYLSTGQMDKMREVDQEWQEHNRKINIAAIAALQRAIKQKPDNVAAWVKLGWVYEKESRSEDAIAAYRQAIKLKPDDAEAWSGLGSSYNSAKQVDNAIAAYQQAIKLKLDDAGAWFGLGLAYSTAKRGADAIAAYEQAVKLKPDDSIAWNCLFEAYESNFDIDKVLDALRQMEKRDPSLAQRLRSSFQAGYGKDDAIIGAIVACQKAAKLKPEDAQAWNDLGVAYLKAYRRNDAIAACQKAIELKPDFAEAWNNLGQALRMADRRDDAVTAYEKAVTLKPNYAEAWYNLALAYDISKGQLEKARDAVRQLLKLDPAMGERLRFILEGPNR